jgi:hypothetical protein
MPLELRTHEDGHRFVLLLAHLGFTGPAITKMVNFSRNWTQPGLSISVS